MTTELPNTIDSAASPATSSRRPRSGERLTFNVGEAAELLGVSRAFAYELVARGELPAIRLGRRILIPRHALAAFVDTTP